MSRCTAKAKGSQSQCKNPVAPGRTKCRFHGGATPRGLASPHFKHGRYSKHLPTKLGALLNSKELPSELLSLQYELVLFDTRLKDLTTRLNNERKFTDHQIWKEIRTTIEGRRKLAEAETKRLKDLQFFIPADRAMSLIGFFGSVIKWQVGRYAEQTIARKIMHGINKELDKVLRKK